MKLPGVASLYGPLKDACLYIKHRHRHVKDLDDNFKTLSLMHGNLLARGEDIKEKLKFKTRNNTYHVLRRRIQDITRKYKQIEFKYKKWGGNSSTQVARNDNVGNEGEGSTSSTQVATNDNVGNEGERSTGSTQVETNDNVGNEGEGSTSSPQVAHNQRIGRRKIWTKNFFNNARLDKDVIKLSGEIYTLKIEDVKLETLVTEEICVQRVNAPKKDCMPLSKYVKEILEHLEKASTKSIGIHGEAQVGKSTVLKLLNNCFYPKPSSSSSSSSISLKYERVIWVDFPSEDSGDVTENMQQQILRRIYGQDEQSSRHNATRINEALAKIKYLLILDDVYKVINLADLGIHDDHKLGQIIIGATGKGVLNCMQVDESILIEKLGYNDAETFFKECLGVAESGVDLLSVQPYMEKIIKLVGGHIGALVGIANYMKGLATNITDLDVWKFVIQNLQSSNSPQKLKLGALEKSYKLSYDGLKDKHLKKCLLYVALFPVGYRAHKSYLVECWKAEDFLEDYHTFKDARIVGHNMCLRLTETHLLEWSGEEHLKMSLLFRKVALQIPYPDDKGDSKILVQNISKRFDHPYKQDWDIFKRISLMCGKLDSNFLPNCPMCNNTSTLLLQKNLELRDIGKQFFINMGNLRVLDLQSTGIIGLPKSISALGHLKCLYLNDCSSLQSLPTEMKKLNQLELLDIRYCTLIRCLPREIWCLQTLRCLRISVHSQPRGLRNIVMHFWQPNFSTEILKLKFLEELTVHVDPQTPDRESIINQIKTALEEDQELKVILEPEGSYLQNPNNNVVANGSGLNEFISLSGSQSNGHVTTLPHSSSPIAEITTTDYLKHVNQLENTEASTSTTNSQHTQESTKNWVLNRFQHK